MRPVVFLDLDDVLCVSKEYNSFQVMMCFRENQLDWPELWAGLVDPHAARNLRLLHDDFEPQYVVSSSWSTYLDQTQMGEVFARTQLHFVQQNLHDQWTTPRASSWSRREEIEAWLEKFHTPSQPFLVLDDMESGWTLAQSPLMSQGHVVLCEAYQGFTVEALQKAGQLLRQQLINR